MEEKYYLVVFGIGLLLLLWLGSALAKAVRRFSFKKNDRAAVQKGWREVEALMHRGDAMSMRMAVVHADAVLDMALKSKHFSGKTMGERMKFAGHRYRAVRKVGWAHGLRNTLVHEAHQEVKRTDAQQAIRAFKLALIELGAL